MNTRVLAFLLFGVPFVVVASAHSAIWDTPILIEQGQVVPPSGSPAAASGMFVLDTANNQLQFNLNLDNPLQGNEIFAGVYGPAEFGQNGPLLFQLPNGWPKNGFWAYPDSVEGVLLNNLTYVQIDTDTAPSGEIRGQLAAWQAQGLTQQDALEYLVEVIVPFRGDDEDFTAHFVGLGTSDSLLTAGSVVADYDSTFLFVVPNDMYFFWVDNEPMTEWFHDTTFYFMDAMNGQLVIENGMSWPIINGADHIMSDDESADCQLPPRVPLLPDYPMVDTANTDAWALIVVGKNLGVNVKTEKKLLEQDARKNDIERIEEYLNGVSRGPKIDKDNIKLAAGSDTLGATLQEVCDQLDAMNGCSKLYFFYIGHGSQAPSKANHDGKQRTGHMILRRPSGNLNEEFTYYQLACKLLEKTSVKEVCVTIEACYSGKAVKTFTKEIPAQKGKRLKGSLVTSSIGEKKTRRGADGSFFVKAFYACSKASAGDFNVDGSTTPAEAAGWAELNDAIVANDDPQITSLGGSSDFKFKKQPRPIKKLRNGGRLQPPGKKKLIWEIITYKYTVKGSAGQDSCITKKRLVVRNRYDEFYKGDCVMQWRENRPGATWKQVPAIFHFYPSSHDKCNWTYLGELDPRTTSISVRKAPNKGRLPDIAVFSDSVTWAADQRSTAYKPGEHVLQDFDLRGNPGDQFSWSLTGIPGWGVTTDHFEFNSSATQGQLPFAVRADAPLVVSNGGRMTLEIANLSCPDTLYLEFDALVYDSLTADEGPGSRSFEALDMVGGLGLDATGGTVFWDNTSMHLNAAATASIPVGGTLQASESQIEAEEGTSIAFDVQGRLQVENFAVVRPTNGLHLDAPDSSRMEFTFVVASAGDGLWLEGDLSKVSTDMLFVDQSADDGLEASGVSGAQLDAVIISNSGDQDVVLSNNSTVLLRNSYFDDTKVSVDFSSQLTRSWSVGIGVEDSLGNPLDLAVVEVRDALNTLVASFVTDDDGFSPILELNEWVQNGATRTMHTPHAVSVMRGNVSENFVVNINDKEYPVLVMSQVVSNTGNELPRILSMAQNAPNPFGAAHLGRSTRISYALPRQSDVHLMVYNVRGQLVTKRSVLQQRPGWHHFEISAQSIASGVYWYELRTLLGSERRKMIVIK